MKKKILLIIISILIIPINVLASKCQSIGQISVQSRDHGGEEFYRVLGDGISNDDLFCIDKDKVFPSYVDKWCELDLSKKDDRGLGAIYRMYLANGSQSPSNARKAMREFISQNKKENGGSKSSNSSIMNSDNAYKMYYCAGTVAAGGMVDTAACNTYLEGKGFDTSFLNMNANEFSVNFIAESTDASNGIYTVKLTGHGYQNILDLFSKGYSRVKNGSSITIKSCSVADSNYKCELVGGSQNLLDKNEQQIRITATSAEAKISENFKITIKYVYDFPFVITSTYLAVYSCNGEDCSFHTEGGSLQQYYTLKNEPTQRLVWVRPYQVKKELSSEVNVTGDTSCHMGKEGSKTVYYIGDKEVTEIEYITKCSCTSVEPKNLETQEAKNYYKANCQVTDEVHFETECGTRDIIGKAIDQGTGLTTTTCENESYVNFTKSYVNQAPMKTILNNIDKLEREQFKDDLTGIYEYPTLNNYLDRSYLNNQVTGGGRTLAAVSAGNNYCMMFTSENDDIYFPGTAISSSGRYFVFNELDKSECNDAINPGANCFRQPYIVGNIYTTMHTNYTKWDRDYRAAIDEEKSTYNTWQGNKTDANKQLYDAAKLKRETLEKYKTECEQRNDIESYWKYNLNPSLSFSYKQKVYGAKEKVETVTDTVPMEISYQGVRYWPNASTNQSVITGSKTGARNEETYTISYGNVNETKRFDKTVNYQVGFTRTIYFKPAQVTYSTIPSGQYILQNEEYQTSPVTMLENGMKIGYVYNVRLTTYEGAYTTSFAIDNVGHLGLNNESNVQRSIDEYKKENNITELASECVYCNQEGQFQRVCDSCPDPNNPDLAPKFVYRTVSLSNVTPNERENTNWSDAKGSSAKANIEALSGEAVVSSLANQGQTTNMSLLGEANTSPKLEALATGDIYDDGTREYIEYEFTLTTNDMQIIKRNTARNEFNYGSMNLCGDNGKVTGKDANLNYCFICNADGKECESSFIDSFADTATNTLTRNNKWKYYINNKWYSGTWDGIVRNNPEILKLEGFEDGKYPDPINQNAFIKVYKNWP